MMNRPIKFRGRTKSGKLVYGEYSQAFMGNTPKICYFDEDGCWNCKTVDEDSIAQLVGYDRYGNEVYEGDTLILPYGDEYEACLSGNVKDGDCARIKELQQ